MTKNTIVRITGCISDRHIPIVTMTSSIPSIPPSSNATFFKKSNIYLNLNCYTIYQHFTGLDVLIKGDDY
jgi:hypothetical protein